MLHKTSGQSSSERCRTCPKQLNESTPSKHSAPSSPVRLKVAFLALFWYIYIPSPPPHLHIPVSLCCPAVFLEPPCWHVHPTQVSAGKQLLPLLDHRYPRPKILEHEMLPQTSRIVCYRGATRDWAPY